MLILLYAALFAANAINSFSQKKYSNGVSDLVDTYVFSIVTGVIACLFFWCSNRFSLSFNLRTVVYSAVYAAVVLAAQVLGLLALRSAGITNSTVIRSAVSLPSIWALGLLLFRESFAWNSLISCLLMLAAGILLSVSRSKGEMQRGELCTVGVVLSVCAGLPSVFSTLLNKFFAVDLSAGTVTDSNSYFFLTNVFLLVICSLILPILCRRSGMRAADRFKQLSPKRIGLIVLSTVGSNVGSLLGVRILSIGTVSLYGPLSSALSMLAGFAVGMLFFREKPKLLPLLLTMASVGLGFFS